MILSVLATVAFAGDYDVTLRIEDRHNKVVVDQARAIADDTPRAIPFLWKREPASALVVTHDDKVCFWLVDEDGAALQILGTGGCTTLGNTTEATTTIDAPEGQVVLSIRASGGVAGKEGVQPASFTPPPAAR
jgi:hypothetical protein